MNTSNLNHGARLDGRPLLLTRICIGFISVAGLALEANAADASWTSAAAGNWSTGANWNPSTPPGSTSGTTNMDTAIFGATTGSKTITVDSNRNIFGINFSGNSSTYNLAGGPLLLTTGGTIQTSGAGSNHTDFITAPITITGESGTFTFASDSSASGRS